jgi:ribosomal-protein-serine acetyltransferase
MLKNNTEFSDYVGPTIILNFLQQKDADVLFKLVSENRSYLCHWLPWLNTIKTSVDESIFITEANKQWHKKTGLTLGIWCNDALKGVISFNQIDLNTNTAEIGYWIDERYQSQGIVTRSCRKLIEIGFEQLRLSTILISCATKNFRSQRVAIKLGFLLYKTVPSKEWLYDHYVDHHVYKLDHASYVNTK